MRSRSASNDARSAAVWAGEPAAGAVTGTAKSTCAVPRGRSVTEAVVRPRGLVGVSLPPPTRRETRTPRLLRGPRYSARPSRVSVPPSKA